jgi:hypothetical protein
MTHQAVQPEREFRPSVPLTSAYEEEATLGMAPRSLRAAKREGPGPLEKLAGEFSEEIGMVKAMVFSGLVGAAAEWAKTAAPDWSSQIEEVTKSVRAKLEDRGPEPSSSRSAR